MTSQKPSLPRVNGKLSGAKENAQGHRETTGKILGIFGKGSAGQQHMMSRERLEGLQGKVSVKLGK